jgi:glycosyltransferase involved in cell wall biosynthesis
MNILLTVHQFFPQYAAGTEVLTYSVARELMRLGHVVRILAGHPGSADLSEGERFDEYDFEGIHVYRFHHAYTEMAGQTSKIELDYNNRLAASYCDRILQSFKPDLLHIFHLNRLGSGLIDYAVQAGIPCFMTPTDFWPICPTGQLVYSNGSFCSGPSANAGNCVKHFAQSTQGGLAGGVFDLLPVAGFDFLAKWTKKGLLPPYPYKGEVIATTARLDVNIARLNQLKALIVPNEFMGALLVRYGISPALIIQSAFGIDIESSKALEPRSFIRQPLRVGFIGTLAPHKGCHVLVEAFKSLPSGQAVLKIYGSLEDHPEYSNMVRALSNNREDIEFCGTFHNSKIGDVLAALDVLVVPSLWYENTPLVVYSAQASHCPVVASDLPGITVVIQNEVNGLLFTPGDNSQLARQLARLVNEPELAMRLSNNSKPPKSIASYVDELLEVWAGNVIN